jgi:hypothetical protein
MTSKVHAKFVDALPAERKTAEQAKFEQAVRTMEVMAAREAVDFLHQVSQYDQQVYLAAEELGANRPTILREFPNHPKIRERCKSYAN